MAETVLNVFLKLINIILNFIIDGLNFVLGVLPTSPFSHIDLGVNVNKYLSYLAWLVPIKFIVTITTLWLPCLLAYFGVSIILRWFKMIE